MGDVAHRLRGPAAKHALSHTQPLKSDLGTRVGAAKMKNRELKKEEERLEQLEEQLQEAIEAYAAAVIYSCVLF